MRRSCAASTRRRSSAACRGRADTSIPASIESESAIWATPPVDRASHQESGAPPQRASAASSALAAVASATVASAVASVAGPGCASAAPARRQPAPRGPSAWLMLTGPRPGSGGRGAVRHVGGGAVCVLRLPARNDLEEDAHELRVELAPALAADEGLRLVRAPRGPVGARRAQRVVDVRDRRDARLVGDLPALELVPVAATVVFPRESSLSIALSSAWSATIFFSCAFSRSSSFRRFAWSTFMPPYSRRQR